MLQVAIFNGFKFHYEVFGYIIHWCQSYGHRLTCYTETEDDYGWLKWYEDHFKTKLDLRPISRFSTECHNYHIIIVITDEDMHFSDHLLQKYDLQRTVMTIDHVATNRRPAISKHLKVRPHPDLPHAYPIYPIDEYSVADKLLSSEIHIYIQATLKYDWTALEELDTDPNVIFHVVGRQVDARFKKFRRVSWHEKMDTSEMIALIARCHYVWYGIQSGNTHIHTSCSGTVPLAFNVGTPLLTNSAVENAYHFGFSVPYQQYRSWNPEFRDRVRAVRDEYGQALDRELRRLYPEYFSISSFENSTMPIPKIIHQVWLSNTNAGIPERYLPNVEQFRRWNPDYEIKTWNLEQALEVLSIKPNWYAFFQRLNLVISKCDFFRMVLLYVYGGLYSDLDFYCMQSVNSLLVDRELAIFEELPEHAAKSTQLFNGFLASTPKHPFIEGWIEYMITTVGPRLPIGVHSVMHTTGPNAFWKYYAGLKNPPALSDPCQMMPYTNQQVRSKICPSGPMVAATLWHEGSSWSNGASAWWYGLLIALAIVIIGFILSLSLRNW